ncbi:hypothetical protein H0H93_001561 [Arthromyces matolae]|nr:hypothetical protein H0H93_001561 [Arthromyces matolae]
MCVEPKNSPQAEKAPSSSPRSSNPTPPPNLFSSTAPSYERRGNTTQLQKGISGVTQKSSHYSQTSEAPSSSLYEQAMNAGATLRNCKKGSQPSLKKAPTIPKPPKPPAPPCAPQATSFKCSIVIMPHSNAVFNQQCQQQLELLGKRVLLLITMGSLERLCWGGLMREFVIHSTNTAAKITANLKAKFASSPAMQKLPFELDGYILLVEDMVSLESARQGKTQFLAPYFKPDATLGHVCKWPNVVFISLSKGSLAINYPLLTLWNEDDASKDAHQSRSLSPLTSSSESELTLPGDSNWLTAQASVGISPYSMHAYALGTIASTPLIDHIVNLHSYLSMAVTARLYKVNCLQNAMD